MDKAHILREIKRTAEANDGVPLGTDRFFAETAIKQSDWCGIHWARWSDAVREAGFMPNQLSEAYEPAELLEKYAILTRDLQRLPSAPDIRLRRRSDPNFPNDSTFTRRWSKIELIKELLAYCRDRTGYESVIALCESYIPREQPEAEPEEPAVGEVTMGYVYLIKMGRYYKIGMTNSVGRREYEIALQLPEAPNLIHQITTDDPAGIEEYWHRRFAAKRTNGEWFALDAADISAFKRRKFM
ncbi:MAG: hypothetical protein C0467_22600 [Planctomycetaceae bacterium]|nr:hypothetical protein [Planctomycetaceae bacterium]